MNKIMEHTTSLKFRPRPSEDVTFRMPIDVVQSLYEVAETRDMSFDALLRFYIGQGLRQDLAQRYGDLVWQATKEVLSSHIDSEEEVSMILEEIRLKAAV